MPVPTLELKALPSPSPLVDKKCFWSRALNEQCLHWQIAALRHDFHRNNNEGSRDKPAPALDNSLSGQHCSSASDRVPSSYLYCLAQAHSKHQATWLTNLRLHGEGGLGRAQRS